MTRVFFLASSLEVTVSVMGFAVRMHENSQAKDEPLKQPLAAIAAMASYPDALYFSKEAFILESVEQGRVKPENA